MRQGIVFILRIRPSRKLGGVPLYGVAEFFRIFDCKRNLGKAFRKGHHFGFPNRNAENFFGNFIKKNDMLPFIICLLYTSDAADD